MTADPRSPQWKHTPAGHEADGQARDTPMQGRPTRARFAEPHKITQPPTMDKVIIY